MSDIQNAVQKQFSLVASHYRTSAVHASGADLQAMLDNANLPEDALLLDMGCGAGHTALAFAPFVGRVIAYDIAFAMLGQVHQLMASRGIENIATIQGDVGALPFANGIFDAIVSRYSAHHWPHLAIALRECHRVLKPKGTLILSDIVAWEEAANDTFLQTIELLRDPSHVRDYRISEWRALLEAVGFQTEILLQFQLNLDFRAWIERMATPKLNAAMIIELMDGAPQSIKSAFQWPVERHENFEFVIPGVVLRAVQR